MIDDGPEEAVRCYRLAAEEGHAPAQFTLGTMCASGANVAVKRGEAVRWLGKAANADHVHARYGLSLLTAAESV